MVAPYKECARKEAEDEAPEEQASITEGAQGVTLWQSESDLKESAKAGQVIKSF